MLLPTEAACYQAFKAHDARFDGRLFIGVASTGIYCRPVCRVRMPMRKNCTFYASAAAAEAAGFRSCFKCRPELAPGYAAVDVAANVAHRAAAALDNALGEDLDLTDIADQVGVSARHLRRVFVQAFGVTPIQYIQTQRLLLAKRLLTDTAMSITEIAFASGFSSLRRMNASFLERYQLAPSRLRRALPQRPRTEMPLVFLLAYRPPYAWHTLLDFLRARAIEGVEHVTALHYARILQFESQVGWLSVRNAPSKAALEVTLAPTFSRVVPPLLSALKRVFDVHAAPVEVAAHLATLPAFETGLRIPGVFDPFELCARAVLGQQISVGAARTLAARFAQAFGEPVSSGPNTLTTAFPSAARIAKTTPASIADLGIVQARASCIHTLATEIATKRLRFETRDQTYDHLRTIKGIGVWTAEYITMRALSWPDAWPEGDVVLHNRLDLPKNARKEARTLSQRWSPWRSYAVLHLWNTNTQEQP